MGTEGGSPQKPCERKPGTGGRVSGEKVRGRQVRMGTEAEATERECGTGRARVTDSEKPGQRERMTAGERIRDQGVRRRTARGGGARQEERQGAGPGGWEEADRSHM